MAESMVKFVVGGLFFGRISKLTGYILIKMYCAENKAK